MPIDRSESTLRDLLLRAEKQVAQHSTPMVDNVINLLEQAELVLLTDETRFASPESYRAQMGTIIERGLEHFHDMYNDDLPAANREFLLGEVQLLERYATVAKLPFKSSALPKIAEERVREIFKNYRRYI